MQTIDLIELLAARPIHHPTRIDQVLWRGSRLTISTRGYPWWDASQPDFATEGALALVFDGVSDGILSVSQWSFGDWDEALEGLYVTPISEVPWAQTHSWAVYSSAPLPDPMSLYRTVNDYLYANEAFRRPADFLNQADDLSNFMRLARFNGFMVARGPSCIRDLVCAELKRQSVAYNVLEQRGGPDPKFMVRLSGSIFFCESAVAEFAG